MRRHGWQLPYHPLQVVAVAVFLALGFAFYVFFAPFVGKKLFQYIIMGVYTPLIVSVFGLYIWCAASDPADPGVFKSKKYCKTPGKGQHAKTKDSKLGGEPPSSKQIVNAGGKGANSFDRNVKRTNANGVDSDVELEQREKSANGSSCIWGVVCFPCTFVCKCLNPSEDSSVCEDGMFYCSLCEVEVFKYSKHCRVCDKCVDHFDHHCRWVNNCIGKSNYRQFFTLMIIALLLLILQWSTGILVLIYSFLEHERFNTEIISKLGSSFSIVPFAIVVGVCTILAMLATLPLAQLFFFHILLITKGITTYDYIVALREQEQQEAGGGQSPQMSQVSSFTGLSSASSFNTFRRGAWCTPPRLFLEDQFDVVPPDTGSVSSYGKRTAVEEPIKKRKPPVKISPWTLARLNGEEVSKAAAEARKKSKIFQPVIRQPNPLNLERDNSFGSSGRQMVPRLDHSRRRGSKRIRLPAEMPLESPMNVSSKTAAKASSSSLAPLQLEARSAFRTSLAMSSTAKMAGSSPESSSLAESPDGHPFHLSSSGAEESRRLTGPSVAMPENPFSRSTSDGYEASGGEDSDQVPCRPEDRPVNWKNMTFRSNPDGEVRSLKASSSSAAFSLGNLRKY